MHITSSHTCTQKPSSGLSEDAPFFLLGRMITVKENIQTISKIHNFNPSHKLCGHYQIILAYWSQSIYSTYPNLNIRFNLVYMTI